MTWCPTSVPQVQGPEVLHVSPVRFGCTQKRPYSLGWPSLPVSFIWYTDLRPMIEGRQPVFEGFTLEMIELPEATLRVRHGGSGPPVLLLHGHPRTHATWHRVAPILARSHTVVCPDLRGFGGSSSTPTARAAETVLAGFVAA